MKERASESAALADPSGRPGEKPPVFTVDLSLPPEDRYAHIAPQLATQIEDADLLEVFDDLIYAWLPTAVARLVRMLAPVFLRRVYTDEETAELRGISRAAGVPMFLLVAVNVLLDLLMGCTSGGVRVQAGESDTSRMVHFRTLDWGMDPLRKLVVELNFVRRPGGPVVASAITYFGYVGVLTGVRRGISMSLNFRPHHDRSSVWKRMTFRWQQLMVILGQRPSISSDMRRYLLGGSDAGAGKKTSYTTESIEESKNRRSLRIAKKSQDKVESREEDAGLLDMPQILSDLSTSASTAAYLIFCTPERVYCIEKDHKSSAVRSSRSFMTTYNHDVADESNPAALANTAENLTDSGDVTGLDWLLAYSIDRKNRLDGMYQKDVERQNKRLEEPADQHPSIRMKDVLQYLKDDMINNEETHYATIMDPETGTILWRRVYEAED
jgi:hypothetical protein